MKHKQYTMYRCAMSDGQRDIFDVLWRCRKEWITYRPGLLAHSNSPTKRLSEIREIIGYEAIRERKKRVITKHNKVVYVKEFRLA